jgi:5-methylcytosine-specific restriction endonuclease McrA
MLKPELELVPWERRGGKHLRGGNDVVRGPLREGKTQELWLDGRELQSVAEGAIEFCSEMTLWEEEFGCDVSSTELYQWFELEDDHMSHIFRVANMIAEERANKQELRDDNVRPTTLAGVIEHHNERDRLGGDLTLDQWLALKNEYKSCAYCEVSLGTVIEHVRPLSRGGRTTLTNIVPSCWSCNHSKSTDSAEEWLPLEHYEKFESRRARAYARVVKKLKKSAA